MSYDVAIKVENLSKCYLIYDAPRDRLKQFVVPRLQQLVGLTPKQYYREFWAIRDISFEVERGETVGIIGRNGSGKSTLLQLICGTVSPTAGAVSTDGRIAALLELGSGFNPEFTGRDNVYMSCSLLGLDKNEVDQRFDDIAAFADIGEFIDQPVKSYSSGMFVRLAFSVNLIAAPSILIVDEALAVGDLSFQVKCMTALKRFQANGGTLLFVSHDVGAVKSLCRKCVYLEHGRLVSSGPAPEVADLYVRSLREEMSRESRLDSDSFSPSTNNSPLLDVPNFDTNNVDLQTYSTSSLNSDDSGNLLFKSSEQFNQRVAACRYGTGRAIVRYVELLDTFDQPIVIAEFDQLVKIRIHFDVIEETELSVIYYILDEKRNLILGSGLTMVGLPLLKCSQGSRRIGTYTTKLPLMDGNYVIEVQLTKPIIFDETVEFLDVIENAVVFSVARRPISRVWSKVYIDNEFTLTVI